MRPHQRVVRALNGDQKGVSDALLEHLRVMEGDCFILRAEL
jgi:hypothetical protein